MIQGGHPRSTVSLNMTVRIQSAAPAVDKKSPALHPVGAHARRPPLHRTPPPLPVASHPVELSPVDIAPYRGGSDGPEHVLSWTAARPGPHVVVNALMHGNELCGALALDALLRAGLRPRRGRLTFCFANVAAYHAFDPLNPSASRFVEEDMNRVWAPEVLEGPRQSAELARARALLPLFATADLLLDIHSMQTGSPPLTLCGPTERGATLAARVGLPAWIVTDSGHAGGRRLIDHPRFADPDGAATAILVECGQHWRRETADVALQVALRFLLAAGSIDAEDVDHWASPPPPEPQRRVLITRAVTATSEDFRFVQDYEGMEVIGQAGTVIARDGDVAVTTPHDDCVLVMPSRRLKPGQTAVRLGRLLP